VFGAGVAFCDWGTPPLVLGIAFARGGAILVFSDRAMSLLILLRGLGLYADLPHLSDGGGRLHRRPAPHARCWGVVGRCSPLPITPSPLPVAVDAFKYFGLGSIRPRSVTSRMPAIDILRQSEAHSERIIWHWKARASGPSSHRP